MKKIRSYCDVVKDLGEDNVHRIYHDTAYGFPIKNDDELFERLILEINQAGLSWDMILKKQKNFRVAFNNFNIKKVASYKTRDRQRLLADAGIIRNRLKIDATIYNAQVILMLQKEFGSFQTWLNTHKGNTKDAWVELFKQTFKFTGGEIVNEFLMSTGYLAGSHSKSCPVYHKIVIVTK